MSQLILRGALAAALAASLFSHACGAWTDHVVASCAPDKRQDELAVAECHAYIDGFLDGALVTDKAIVHSITGKDEVYSDFFQRAYATRLGAVTRSQPATALAGFCLPEDQSRPEILQTIATALGESRPEGPGLHEEVYATIKTLYPCS